MDAHAEAFERLGGAYDVRVLEVSPPSVACPAELALDPTARGPVPRGRTLVSPVTSGDLLWDELAAGDLPLARWCAERWLGAYRRLGDAPAGLAATRAGLHALARSVIAPLCIRAGERAALRWSRGGFATRYFGAAAQVRVERNVLVVTSRFRERRAPISTLAAAAAVIGFELTGDEPDPFDLPLAVDAGAARFAGDFLGFATAVLEQVRAEVPASFEPSTLELSPETFELTVEVGLEQPGRRLAVGASLGDAGHPEPYLFATPIWADDGGTAAELPYADILDAADQRDAALDFVRARLQAVHAPVLER